jgi:hypothetical protein
VNQTELKDYFKQQLIDAIPATKMTINDLIRQHRYAMMESSISSTDFLNISHDLQNRIGQKILHYMVKYPNTETVVDTLSVWETDLDDALVGHTFDMFSIRGVPVFNSPIVQQ